VAELRVTEPTVVAVLASTEACDRLAIEGAEAYRIGVEEVMVVGEVTEADVGPLVRANDPGALVIDVSDGWTSLELFGDGARDAFARLSELELPREGFVQGDVLRVAVRVLAGRDGIRLLVPAMWAHHVETRVRHDAAELIA
jgi:hypothetical protein